MANDPFSPLAAEEEHGKSALVLVIIIILLLLIGGIYALNSQKTPVEVPAEENTQSEVVSTSTNLDDIDRDLDNLEAGAIDIELNELDQEAQGLQ